ncbi:hypothetical protein EVAR_100401_1 [Eumeta japonica]|uniref:Uncharacterized protein n=1 Tax=Eumeta variegata TaxID=151549 RepID=A0A4C2AJ09_EUMVA|nr:hypothetical protein EVAR_100401_1 [Eumeta japonica]
MGVESLNNVEGHDTLHSVAVVSGSGGLVSVGDLVSDFRAARRSARLQTLTRFEARDQHHRGRADESLRSAQAARDGSARTVVRPLRKWKRDGDMTEFWIVNVIIP